MELEFIRYNDNYENEVNLINKEMASERKITNLGGFDKKKSKLVVLNGKVIGFSSVLLSRGTPTIQYGIKKEYRNCGYGTILLDKLTDDLFNDGYDRVELMISPKNKPSMALAEKVGYQIDYSNGGPAFNPENEESMYITYYKNSYTKKYGRTR